MKTVWIDLTDIEKWTGQHGGTQRVVYGIVKAMFLKQQDSDNLKFFRYSERRDVFVETSFALIYERVEALKQGAAASGPAQEPIAVRLKKAAIRYTPSGIQSNKQLKRLVLQSGKQSLLAAKKARASLCRLQASLKAQSGKNIEPIEFAPEDTVLVLGKPWDNLGIQTLLTKQKSQANFRLVQVVYDLIIPFYPQLHHTSLFVPYTQHMFEAIAASDVMLPISKSSARDLKEFCRRLNLKEPVIKVIRLGDDIAGQFESALQEKPDPRIAPKFIAYVGTVEIRKNHMLLYYTYKLAAAEGVDLPQLVIVGGKGWLSDDFLYLVKHDPTMKNKLVLLHSVNDAGLDWIYRNCLLTVYPSIYEGWGLPIAESLGYSKLCLASNASSMTEIAGDLLEYFSPYSSQECLSLIEKYLDPQNLLQKEGEIRDKYKPTSWDATYEQIRPLL